jgi:hypothetical protein
MTLDLTPALAPVYWTLVGLLAAGTAALVAGALSGRRRPPSPEPEDPSIRLDSTRRAA